MGDASLSFRTLDTYLRGQFKWESAEDSGEEAFAAKKLSSLDISVMMRADLETIRRIYEMHPAALTPELLRNCCNHGWRPGVVRFLAEKLPTGACQTDKAGEMPIHKAVVPGPNRNRRREGDVKALLDIYPEAINIPGSTGWKPWEVLLHCNYSSELVRFAFQKLYCSYSTRDILLGRGIISPNPGTFHRRALDMDCIEGMSPVFSHVSKFRVSRKHPWRVDAFIQCFRVLLEKPNIKQIKLAVRFLNGPDGYPVNENPSFVRGTGRDQMIALEPAQSLLQLAPNSAVEALKLDFGHSSRFQNLPQLLWNVILRLPCLRELRVAEFDDGMPLIRLIETSTKLVDLEVILDHCAPEINLFDPLAQNAVLKRFRVEIRSFDPSQGGLTSLEECRGRLASILQLKNTTIEKAEIVVSGVPPEGDPFTASQAKIKYYTNLNRKGRAMARNPHTKKADFVQLLCVQEDSELCSLDISNIRYGLLRELPSFWSEGASGGGVHRIRNRKRKRSKCRAPLSS